MADAPAAGNGVLSIEQATAELTAAPKKEKDPAEDTRTERELEQDNETTEIEADPTAESDFEPEEAIEDEDDAEPGEDDAEVDETEQQPLEPPKFWDAKKKDRFRELPRDMQETILQHEDLRTSATAKAMQEAADKRKAADGEASRIAHLGGVLDKLLPQVLQTFKSRWEGVDWNAVVDEHGAEGYLKLKNEFESEKAQIQQLSATKGLVELENTKRHIADRLVKLQTTCPDLVDPAVGVTRQADLLKYLEDKGVPKKLIIEQASDVELSIAYKAMRWDQAKANTAKLAQQTKTVPATRQAARPSAAPATRSPNNARIQQLAKKPTLSIDEATELATLRGT